MKHQFDQIIRGLWQLSSGHQIQQPSDLGMNAILDSIQCGMRTFDCADIYSGVETLLGEIHTNFSCKSIQVHTKFVPDLDQLHKITFSYTSSIVERSIKRLRVDAIDLVQFHWWDYDQPYYLDALEQLTKLKAKGLIKRIGLTNFDSNHLSKILSSGFELSSIQLQASVIDRRVETSIRGLCNKSGIQILAYGTILGGFLSDYWMGKPEPKLEELPNRSLIKYKLIIDDWGGWTRFQNYLVFLSKIARKYRSTISRVGIQSVIQGNLADSVIVGLSPKRFLSQNRELQSHLILKEEDLKSILSWKSKLIGDVYELERRSKHSSIMRTHLNRSS